MLAVSGRPRRPGPPATSKWAGRSDRSVWAAGDPSAGDTRKRRAASASSIAAKYKLSSRAREEGDGDSAQRGEGRHAEWWRARRGSGHPPIQHPSALAKKKVTNNEPQVAPSCVRARGASPCHMTPFVQSLCHSFSPPCIYDLRTTCHSSSSSPSILAGYSSSSSSSSSSPSPSPSPSSSPSPSLCSSPSSSSSSTSPSASSIGLS